MIAVLTPSGQEKARRRTMELLIYGCLGLAVATIAVACHRYFRPINIRETTFHDLYDLRELAQALRQQYGYECNQILIGESRTIKARSAFQARMKEIWYQIRRPPAKAFDVSIYRNNLAQFSVTAEFDGPSVVAIYLKATTESRPAAEFWIRAFRTQFPNAPLDPEIRAMQDPQPGQFDSPDEVNRRAQTIPLP